MEKVQIKRGETKVKYEVLGIDSVFYCQINSYSYPEETAPRQEMGRGNINLFPELIEDSLFNVVIKSGVHEITKPLIIPSSKQLIINSGTELNFSGEGFLLSYSPVHLNGDIKQPIIIRSKDGRGGSFTVIQSDKRSSLRHVVFDGQNTMVYGKWNLTGAVNFYESDVDLVGIIFRNNTCEDALNIIRSEFQMEQCSFFNTYGDAFDADFCKGTVNRSFFSASGNDAMDFSGSIITIENTQVHGAGDKGVSSGERSNINLVDVEIEDAVIGVASKDRSVLNAKYITIKNCQTAFAAFQKKPEYGPSTIELKNYKLIDIKRAFLIEDNSSLILNE